MGKEIFNNIKLGIFILGSLAFLILLFYMIGKNRNFFGSNFTLKSRFENVQGLKIGNNVRYAGIDIGSVNKIEVLNDTVLEVKMIIENKMKKIIRNNSIVSIGTDGLVGNKVVNITSTKLNAPLVKEDDILSSRRPVDTDDLLRTFSKTNNDIYLIAKNLKKTTFDFNQSNILWKLLNDNSIVENIHLSLSNLHSASIEINNIVKNANSIMDHIKSGNGSIGTILYDTAFTLSIKNTLNNVNNISNSAIKLSDETKETIKNINYELMKGDGAFNKLLKDSITGVTITSSIKNIENGTRAFNLNMEALKHSFLFRGYFKKISKKNIVVRLKSGLNSL